MQKESPSFYHKVSDNLTINLAEVGAVKDDSEWLVKIAAEPENNPYAQSDLAAGTPCYVLLRSYEASFGRAHQGGQKFKITRDEMTILQDALEWYNKTFTARS